VIMKSRSSRRTAPGVNGRDARNGNVRTPVG
jgi:hypothetical protein